MSISTQNKLNVLSIICGVLQIAGIIMIVFHKQLPAFTPILIGIAGFAAIVKYFIIEKEGFVQLFNLFAAFAGFGIIWVFCAVQ